MEFNHIAPEDADMDTDIDGHKESNANPDPVIWSEVSGNPLFDPYFPKSYMSLLLRLS